MIFYLRACTGIFESSIWPIGLCHFYIAYGTSALIFKANIPMYVPLFLKDNILLVYFVCGLLILNVSTPRGLKPQMEVAKIMWLQAKLSA